MKQIFIVLILLTLASGAFAHAANAVRLRYFPDTKMMTVSFDHSVNDATKHYINKIQLKINGNVVVTQSFNRQESDSGGSLVYKLIDLKAGDVIEATAICNKGGKNTKKLMLK